jgi:hypothetical protein
MDEFATIPTDQQRESLMGFGKKKSSITGRRNLPDDRRAMVANGGARHTPEAEVCYHGRERTAASCGTVDREAQAKAVRAGEGSNA